MEDNKCPAVIVLDSVPRQPNVGLMITPRRLRIALVGILIRIEGYQVKGRTSQGERIIATTGFNGVGPILGKSVHLPCATSTAMPMLSPSVGCG